PRLHDYALLITKGVRRNIRRTPSELPLASVAVVVTGVLVLVGGLVDQRGLCPQDAQGPTRPTFSIVMCVRHPGGASGRGKLARAEHRRVQLVEQFRCAALLAKPDIG